jgi:hypothetical protein
MFRKVSRTKDRRLQRWSALALLLAGIWSVDSVSAQTSDAPATALPARIVMDSNAAAITPATTSTGDPGVVQAGCSTCGGGLFGGAEPMGYGGCAGCGGCGSGCVPGRLRDCCGCCGDTCVGRMLCGIYECICCPDPCYEPRWVAAANAAFFVEDARPVTQMTLRYDAGLNMQEPDRSEYFWAKIGGKGPKKPETSLQYNELSLITEAAAGNFGLAVAVPYLSIDPDVNPHAANFGDISITPKSLLLDCELLQIAFQFRTYIPTGNFTHGIGNGHVSLEPSLLAALKLTPSTYLQAQLAEWIPVGGDSSYEGAILHYHASLNQVLWRPIPDVQLIGTAEFNGWSFQAGQFTDPVLGPFQKSSGDTFLSAGPGLRLVVCDKVDFGVGAAFELSGPLWPNELYRAEFRWRF